MSGKCPIDGRLWQIYFSRDKMRLTQFKIIYRNLVPFAHRNPLMSKVGVQRRSSNKQELVEMLIALTFFRADFRKDERRGSTTFLVQS